MKIALFDFCETLVNYQTADYYVEYTLKKYNRIIFYKKITEMPIIKDVIERNWKIRKKLRLFFLKGLSEKQMQEAAKEYYLEFIKPNSFPYMIKMIKEYQDKEYSTYIVSGGYGIYINEYVKEYGLDGVIANEFKYTEKKGIKIFSGFIQGKDCMDYEKIDRLIQLFKNCKIDASISYSDSLSDLPLLKWTDTGVLVSKYKERKSAKENGLEQIVLKDLESDDTLFEFGGIEGK